MDVAARSIVALLANLNPGDSLAALSEEYSKKRIYTTFIGMDARKAVLLARLVKLSKDG